jgi:hypothetical protein
LAVGSWEKMSKKFVGFLTSQPSQLVNAVDSWQLAERKDYQIVKLPNHQIVSPPHFSPPQLLNWFILQLLL